MDSTKQTGPRDVFMQLLSILTLYVSVIALGGLLFQFINIYFPDPLAYEAARYARSALRWPLAILTVVFPLHLWTYISTERDLVRTPEKREFKLRKWLLYLTLFLTLLVIAGDLIALIFQYLNGELSVRFFLKIIVIFAIAAAVFVSYAWNLRKNIPATEDPRMKLFIWSVTGLIALSILAGFFTAGSPQAERLRREDDRRVGDLQSIQWQIINIWQAKQTLPQSLDELRDEIGGFVPPIDPITGLPYEYRATDKLSFELCATFNVPNDEEEIITTPKPADSYSQDIWIHGKGRHCFSRTIDPDRYPPFTKEQPLPVPMR